MRALILGASGQLGWQCIQDLPRLGIEVRGLDRTMLDVSQGAEMHWHEVLKRHLRDFQPDWVINALAYTAVDRAEDEPQLANQVNGEFPGALARAIRLHAPQSFLLQCSTDYVFDGRSAAPYREGDPTSPLSVYGRSKLRGEEAVMANCPSACVLRFSWVVGEQGQNFAKTMIRLACERSELRVVADQYGVPSPTSFLVKEFSRLMNRPENESLRELPAKERLFHVVPSGRTSWHAYAQLCIATAARHPVIGKHLKMGLQDIWAIQSSEYPSKANRPLNAQLNCQAWCDLHQIEHLADWEGETEAILEKILERGFQLQ